MADPLGMWGGYFAAKVFLFFAGVLRVSFLWNILFLIFVILPLPAKLRGKRWANPARQALNFLLASALLWSDSWLPPVTYVIEFFTKYDLPTASYSFNFIKNTL